jgi:large subunit ribosomal protein L10
MPTEEKRESVANLSRKMSEARSIFLADFTGVDVESVTRLRRSLRGASVEYEVVKNRLAKLAVEDAGLEGLTDYLRGPTAMAFALDDPVAPAKILQQFIDDGGNLAIKSGFMDGQVLTADRVVELSKLPSREELLGRVVSSVQSPIYGFGSTLTGLLRSVIGVLSAIEEQKGNDQSTDNP